MNFDFRVGSTRTEFTLMVYMCVELQGIEKPFSGVFGAFNNDKCLDNLPKYSGDQLWIMWNEGEPSLHVILAGRNE